MVKEEQSAAKYLKPCPFCGSSAEIEEMAMPEGLRYAARCRDDSGKCYVIPTTGLCLSPKDAALFWNWRHK